MPVRRCRLLTSRCTCYACEATQAVSVSPPREGKAQMDYLVTFYTHYGAMRFHRYCVKQGIPAKMAPVPRELSSSCGVCVRINASQAPLIQEHEDMEFCYISGTDGVYSQIHEQC